jgi:hypothetical protein
VGKLHQPDAAVEDVISKEIERLNKAIDLKMND